MSRNQGLLIALVVALVAGAAAAWYFLKPPPVVNPAGITAYDRTSGDPHAPIVVVEYDGPKMKRVFEWAPTEGHDKDISDQLRGAVQSGQLSDADIETKIAEMKAARTARDFKTSDARRAELAEAGIIVEITKDGIRWRRK